MCYKMKYTCEVIQDLLPLYKDEVCSDESKKIVEEHLKECNECSKLMKQLNNYEVDNILEKEKESVLKTHEKKTVRKTYMVGMVTAGILTIPVIVCLICNLAIGHALDWFFIVLTAILVTASIIVVPFIVDKKKLLWTILSFTTSLVLLLLTCCIYTKGKWFFVASSACILGISIIFSPYIFKNINLPRRLSNNIGLISLAWDTLWLYLLLIMCGIFNNVGLHYWRDSMSITTYLVMLVWIIFLIIRYTRVTPLFKTGVIISIIGIWSGLSNDVMNLLLSTSSCDGLGNVDFSQGFYSNNLEVFNANILCSIIVISLVVGIIFIIASIIFKKKRK